jgi:uncharacterized heparinase superfamily protein
MAKVKMPWAERKLVVRLALRRAGPAVKAYAGHARRMAASMVQRLPAAVDFPLKDFRPGDPEIGEQIYTGRFPLARKLLYTDGRAPFDLDPPTPQFARALHAFGWLRHIGALNSELGSANARSLFGSWLAREQRHPAAWRDDVAAARLIALLSHNRLLLRGADAAFLSAFVKSIAHHMHHLRARLPLMRPSAVRIRAHAAIIEALLIMPGSSRALASALRRLGTELDRGVKADGGHVSRSPETMLELLADMAALRQVLIDENVSVPAALQSALDRMYPALRFFLHMDGEPALFNGTGAVAPDRLANVFEQDSTGAATPLRLSGSGFERLAMGGTIIIADVGHVPDGDASATPHAGTLSFEMSSGRHRYIVNGGDDGLMPDEFRKIPRQTAAHSTLCINEASSSLFTGHARLTELLGGPLLEGPGEVTSERLDGEGRLGFRALHSGYVARHGLRHERRITLAEGGSLIEGVDRLVPVSGLVSPRGAPVAIRFHLHPSVHVILDGADNFVLMADGDHSWTFSADDVEPKLIEAAFFAGVTGTMRNKAIMLAFDAAALQEVRWRLSRNGGPL